MTTVVYKNGTLATDTKLTINQENLPKADGIINEMLDDPETDEIDRGILLRTLDLIGGDLLSLYQDGKFIILNKEQQFRLHEEDVDNEVVAIAGIGNMLAFADLEHWLDGTRQNIDEFWYRFNARNIQNAEEGIISEEEAADLIIELMFITKNGCYTWSVNRFNDTCCDECYYPNNSKLAIVMGSGAQKFTDEIFFRVSVAEVDGDHTAEELVKLAMEHDELTGGEVKTFIYH